MLLDFTGHPELLLGVQHRRLLLQPLGNVAGVDYYPGNRLVSQQVPRRDIHHPLTPVRRGEPALDDKLFPILANRLAKLGSQPVPIILMRQRKPITVDQRIGTRSQDSLAGWAHKFNHALAVQHRDDVRGVLDQGAMAQLALAQILDCLPP